MAQTLILGFDEVGRGPLAGPVVVACVATCRIQIPPEVIIRDSKMMSKSQRLQASSWILANTQHAIAQVSAVTIDAIGINPAIRQAATTARNILTLSPDEQYRVVIDGCDHWFHDCETHIKGEDKFPEIAMASIIAKVYRDQLMARLDVLYPQWQFSRHVGYGTVYHRQLIRSLGLIAGVHRRSFCTKIIAP